VFVSTVSVYLFAIIYSHWVQSLVEYTQKYYWELVDYNLHLKHATEEANDIGAVKGFSETQKQRFIDRKMQYLQPQARIVAARLERFNPVYFEISELTDYISDKFDLYVITGCQHFLDENGSYAQIM
jgi:hypothetical protein